MATQLKNIVSFENVAVGDTVALPHHLRWSPPGGGDLPQIPDVCIPSRGGFTVHADDTNVTVTNNTSAPRSVDVYALVWHTFERAFGDQAVLELSPRPFVVNLDEAGAGAGAVLGFGEKTLPGGADAVAYLAPWYEEHSEGGELAFIVDMVAPRAGTLRNLYVRHNNAGNDGDVRYVVMVDGLATALALTLSANAVGQGSNLVDAIPVAAGARVGMRATIGEEGGGGEVYAVATMLFDD